MKTNGARNAIAKPIRTAWFATARRKRRRRTAAGRRRRVSGAVVAATVTGRLLNQDTFTVQILTSKEELKSYARSALREAPAAASISVASAARSASPPGPPSARMSV